MEAEELSDTERHLHLALEAGTLGYEKLVGKGTWDPVELLGYVFARLYP